ncbi:cytotoxic necrotizing factor 1, partial [Yersinia pestis PY-03]
MIFLISTIKRYQITGLRITK